MSSGRVYVAGDFSGIQDYVLGITAEGGGQARRLRARSFYVQVLGEAAVQRIVDAFGPKHVSMLMSGGGQFMLALPAESSREKLDEIRSDMERELYRDLRGELTLTVVWAGSVPEAIRLRERRKRQAWASAVRDGAKWNTPQMTLSEIAPPCPICQKQKGATKWHDEEDICHRCREDIQLGEKLPKTEHIQFASEWGDLSVFGYNIKLGGGGQGSRPLGWYVPIHPDGKLFTFEEIAEEASGDDLLGVFKADVDSMGVKIGEVAARDSSYDQLRKMSDELDRFFSQNLQNLLRHAKYWQHIYTVFSGGDDLLLVGPWDAILNLAQAVQTDFRTGPGRTYGLTLRACRTITFTIRNVLAALSEAVANSSILDFDGVAEGSVASSARR